MSTLNPPKTISKRKELRQDKVVTVYAKAWEFFEEHRMLVYGIGAVLVAVVLAVVGYVYLQSQRGARAQELLGGIVSVYEDGQYENALNGIETNLGLLEIADEYGGTDAGNLAHFYAADALFRLGRYDEALEHFEAFDKGSHLVGASAYAGEAAIYEQRGEYERAGDLYRSAALEFENNVTSPQYLLSAGQAYEEAGAYAKAQDVYQRIKEDFPESDLAGGMDFYLARVQAAMR
jgi:tetratricopeptide (TPR) repeat protein